MTRASAELISPELVLVASPEEAEEARRSLPPLSPAALSAARAPVSVPDRTQERNPDPLAARVEAPALTRPARDRQRALRVAAGVVALLALGTLGVFAVTYELRKPGAQTAAFRRSTSVTQLSPASPAPLKPPASSKAAASARPTTSSTRHRSSVSTSASTPSTSSAPVSSSTAAPAAPTKNLTKQTPAFVPARVFVWVKQSGADAYVIRFFRNDRLVLEGKTTEPRYVLPAGFRFTRGAYRWEVMPVTFGKVGPAIVTSRFVIA